MNPLLVEHAAHAVHGFDIYEPHSPDFQQVCRGLVGVAVNLVLYALDLDEVVGDEHVSAVHQFERRLRFTYACLADEQHAYSADVQQFAVNDGGLGERSSEILHAVALHGGGRRFADEQCHAVCLRHRFRFLVDGVPLRHYHARHALGKQSVQLVRARRAVEAVEIRRLGVAERLHPVGGKMRLESRKKHTGAVDRRRTESDVALGRPYHLQSEVGGEFVRAYLHFHGLDALDLSSHIIPPPSASCRPTRRFALPRACPRRFRRPPRRPATTRRRSTPRECRPPSFPKNLPARRCPLSAPV